MLRKITNCTKNGAVGFILFMHVGHSHTYLLSFKIRELLLCVLAVQYHHWNQVFQHCPMCHIISLCEDVIGVCICMCVCECV